MTSALKHLMQAESIIQRDAVMSALAAAGINAFAEQRDISRKIADTTVDLAYEGYSAVFDGFTIQVNEADYDAAKEIADEVVRVAHAAKPDVGLSEGGALRRFYFCSLFSIMIPGLFHGLAIYHLADGLRKGEKLHPLFAAFSLFILAGTALFAFWLVNQTNLLDILRSWAELL
jgi:hypothetical protein